MTRRCDSRVTYAGYVRYYGVNFWEYNIKQLITRVIAFLLQTKVTQYCYHETRGPPSAQTKSLSWDKTKMKMSRKTKTGEKITVETDEFCFITAVRTAATRLRQKFVLLISAPGLGVYYFLSLTQSVCLYVCTCTYVCLSRCSFKSILLFCFSMESSHFWPSSLHVAPYKTLFFDF